MKGLSVGEAGLGHVDALPVVFRRDHPQRLWRVTRLFFIFLAGVMLLASCGNGDEESETPPSLPHPPETARSSFAGLQQHLPCYVELESAATDWPSATPTPKIIHIQMLERPYRIVPNDIVLRQNQPYQFNIQTDKEWHHFTTNLLKEDLHIPPGGQATILLQTNRLGVFPMEDHRHIPESQVESTITVIPADISASSWHPLCTKFAVKSPTSFAELSTPLVIEGSVEPVEVQNSEIVLYVERVEAWNNGQKVGETTREEFLGRGSHSDFFIAIQTLPAGSQPLLLKAILQNGTPAATAILTLDILPASSSESLLPGFRGNIDQPAENAFLDVPLMIRGWVVVPGRIGAGVGSVEIWNGPRETGQFLTEAVYGIYRPDIAEELGDPRFASSGFLAQLSDIPAGPVDLHVYVRDRESGEIASPRFRQPQLARKIVLAEGKVANAAWPVALAAAPDGRLFFAELLTGNIRILQDGEVVERPFATLEDVSNYQESGLLGIALHPEFLREPYVYAMYVVDNPETGYPLMQRVVRFRDSNGIGEDYTVILDGLPATTVQFIMVAALLLAPMGNCIFQLATLTYPILLKISLA